MPDSRLPGLSIQPASLPWNLIACISGTRGPSTTRFHCLIEGPKSFLSTPPRANPPRLGTFLGGLYRQHLGARNLGGAPPSSWSPSPSRTAGGDLSNEPWLDFPATSLAEKSGPEPRSIERLYLPDPEAQPIWIVRAYRGLRDLSNKPWCDLLAPSLAEKTAPKFRPPMEKTARLGSSQLGRGQRLRPSVVLWKVKLWRENVHFSNGHSHRPERPRHAKLDMGGQGLDPDRTPPASWL